MQALWSRAGQAHHCGCKACFNAAGGMIRQSTTRATRRKPTFSEIFTACYTGIMGTAAVLDAKVKDDRRLELERQLEEARAELDDLKKKRPRRAPFDNPEGAPPGSIENRYRGALWDHVRQKGGIAEVLDALDFTEYEAKAFPRSSEVDRWWGGYGLTTTTQESIARRRITNYEAWDKWLMEEERVYQASGMAHRAPKTLVQLEKSETGMAEMVEDVVGQCKDLFEPGWWLKFRDEITVLRQGNMPHYQRDYDMRAINECSMELNDAISRIFANKNYNPQKKIRKVCHNLLVSPRPPTIFTYNTLLLGFDRLGYHPLAQCVVSAFYSSKVEPTRRTMVCLLNHYRETGEKEQFYNVLRRLTGKDSEGIKIRRKSVEEVLEDDYLFLWACKKDVAITDHFVLERAWFDLPIFTAIVEGLLSFDSLRHAAAAFALALENGITFSARLIRNVLDQCIDALDMKAARHILEAVEKKPKLIAAAFKEETDQLYLAGRIQNLIDISLLDRSLLSVAPWLDVPASGLPSEGKRQGLRIVSIIHQVETSQKVGIKMANRYRKLAVKYRRGAMVRKIRGLEVGQATGGMITSYVKQRVAKPAGTGPAGQSPVTRFVTSREKAARDGPRALPASQPAHQPINLPTERIAAKPAEDVVDDALEPSNQEGQCSRSEPYSVAHLPERMMADPQLIRPRFSREKKVAPTLVMERPREALVAASSY